MSTVYWLVQTAYEKTVAHTDWLTVRIALGGNQRAWGLLAYLVRTHHHGLPRSYMEQNRAHHVMLACWKEGLMAQTWLFMSEKRFSTVARRS